MRSESRCIKVTTSWTAHTMFLGWKTSRFRERKASGCFLSHVTDLAGDAGGPSVSETERKVLFNEHRILNALSRVSGYSWKFVLSCFRNTLKMSKNQRARGTKDTANGARLNANAGKDIDFTVLWRKWKCLKLYIAYFWVHSLACLLYFSLSDL